MASKRKCKLTGEYVRKEDGYISRNNMFFKDKDAAIQWSMGEQAKAKAKRIKQESLKEERKQVRERKKGLKTRSEYMKEAQAAFNAFIRVRDQNKLCISSNKPLSKGGVGGGFDCGHYRSVGSASHLRFNLFNAHGQSKHDNRYLSGNVVDYRINLIKRIGLDRVEKLESDNDPRKFDIDYLKRVKSIFRKRERLYKNRFRSDLLRYGVSA